jgi:putative oxidoreductase
VRVHFCVRVAGSRDKFFGNSSSAQATIAAAIKGANPMAHLGTAFVVIFLIGRIIVGGFFLMTGMHHLTAHSMMTGYAKSKGIPAAGAGVAGSGILLMLGGASMLLGYHPTVGAILLVICLFSFAFGMHNFWTLQDAQAKQMDMVHFMKDLALLGFVLMTLMIPRPWPLSLGR